MTKATDQPVLHITGGILPKKLTIANVTGFFNISNKGTFAPQSNQTQKLTPKFDDQSPALLFVFVVPTAGAST
ncbi:MAG: hypothetical protein ACRBBQ_00575 [Cognatishimia sp.]